jgi:SAM-dependent methyltransferase
MEWYELYDVAERYIELLNPCSNEKVLEAGEVLGLGPQTRLIDYGCGYGEPLVLWAERFGISAVGIEFRPRAAAKARLKMIERGLDKQIEIIEGSGADYHLGDHTFDVASCMGASFIWNGYPQAIRAMKEAIKPNGKILIGEPYWIKETRVPKDLMEGFTIYYEPELLEMARAEGFTFEYLIRSSEEEWARYNAANWRGLVAWLKENANHPDYDQVRRWLDKEQDTYIRWWREYMSWALYILTALPK